MRRHDREITDNLEIFSIMKKCDVCSLAFYRDDFPYIVPMNFGVTFHDNQFTLYFHGANSGTKLELIKNNNHVAFEMNCSHKLVLGEKACDTTMEYESVCGNGVIEILDVKDKIEALSILMDQYQSGKKHEFDENEVKAVTVFKLIVGEIVGKRLKRN
jgi:Predicted flavin-nucleotide-binding protein